MTAGTLRVRTLRAPRRGERIREAFTLGIAENDAALARIIAPPRQIVPDETGESSTPVSTGGGITIKAFTVTGVGFTVLVGDAVDGSLTGLSIAKPWELRNNTGPQTRLVDGEAQLIVPWYDPNDTVILAAEVGVTQTQVSGVDWIDLNVGARAWAQGVGTPPT